MPLNNEKYPKKIQVYFSLPLLHVSQFTIAHFLSQQPSRAFEEI